MSKTVLRIEHLSMHFEDSISIAHIELHAIQTASGVSPNMALGSMPVRPALLIRVNDIDGCYGWGEVWANFPPRAHIHKAQLIEDVLVPKLKGMTFVEPCEVQDSLRSSLAVYFLHVGQTEVFEHILAGLDIALWDLALRKENTTFAHFMQLTNPFARTYASSINTDDLEQFIPHHADLGQLHFKLKIGFLDEQDRLLVENAAALLPDGTRMMVDSNQMWDLQRATESLGWLEKYNPLFAEEPMPANTALADWEALAQSTSIPIAGGENVYGIENFLRMADAGMKVLQPDVAKWGGVTGALKLAKVLPAGTMLWPHFMGSAVGQMAALSIAAAIGHESVCEMDVNDNPLRSGLCGDVMRTEQGCVALSDQSGLVCEPESKNLVAWSYQ